MAPALLTALFISIGGLAAATVLGHTAVTNAEILRHTSIAVFATLLNLLSHSMFMFFVIGKGRALKDAVTEGNLSKEPVAAFSRLRRPVFSSALLATMLTMAAGILGAGVPPRAVPSAVHVVLGYLSLAVNLEALRRYIVVLQRSSRIVADVNRQLGAS